MRDTEHFKASEFECKCGCGKNNVQQSLVDKLEILREQTGLPIVINSGCRCEEWNKKQGGAEQSPHPRGSAADIKCPKINIMKFYAIVEQSGLFNRIGLSLYKKFIHVDIEEPIEPYICVRWWYNEKGGYVGEAWV